MIRIASHIAVASRDSGSKVETYLRSRKHYFRRHSEPLKLPRLRHDLPVHGRIHIEFEFVKQEIVHACVFVSLIRHSDDSWERGKVYVSNSNRRCLEFFTYVYIMY